MWLSHVLSDHGLDPNGMSQNVLNQRKNPTWGQKGLCAINERILSSKDECIYSLSTASSGTSWWLAFWGERKSQMREHFRIHARNAAGKNTRMVKKKKKLKRLNWCAQATTSISMLRLWSAAPLVGEFYIFPPNSKARVCDCLQKREDKHSILLHVLSIWHRLSVCLFA